MIARGRNTDKNLTTNVLGLGVFVNAFYVHSIKHIFQNRKSPLSIHGVAILLILISIFIFVVRLFNSGRLEYFHLCVCVTQTLHWNSYLFTFDKSLTAGLYLKNTEQDASVFSCSRHFCRWTQQKNKNKEQSSNRMWHDDRYKNL